MRHLNTMTFVVTEVSVTLSHAQFVTHSLRDGIHYKAFGDSFAVRTTFIFLTTKLNPKSL
jgi:hypothetical protein